MKKKIARIIEKYVWDGTQEEADEFHTSWDGNKLYWTEKEWENTFEWDGTTGKLTYHTERFELDNYTFSIMPFIMDGMIYFNGPADLAIKLKP